MTTESGTNRTRRHGWRRFFIAIVAIGLAACGDAADDADASDPASRAGSADSAAPPVTLPSVNRPASRPPGDTVAITATLDEYSIAVSPDTIDSGSVSLMLQNDGERPHTIEIRGEDGSRWVSLPIRPGGAITMTMSIQAGGYTVVSTEPAYADRGMSGRFHVR
jgi:hypothetical protein